MADQGCLYSCTAGSYFHYSVPGGYTAAQAKDIGPAKKGAGDPM